MGLNEQIKGADHIKWNRISTKMGQNCNPVAELDTIKSTEEN